MTTRSKLESYLGFGARARKIVSGTNTCIITMDKKKAKLLIIAEGTAENSMEKLIRTADKNGVPWRIYGDSEKLSKLIGKEGKVAFAVTDKNFADCILAEIDGNR